MKTSLIRSPGIYDPKDKAAERAEKKIRKLLGDSAAAKCIAKSVKILIWNIPT